MHLVSNGRTTQLNTDRLTEGSQVPKNDRCMFTSLQHLEIAEHFVFTTFYNILQLLLKELLDQMVLFIVFWPPRGSYLPSLWLQNAPPAPRFENQQHIENQKTEASKPGRPLPS